MPPMPQMRRQGGFGRNPMGRPPFGRQPGFPGPQRPPFMGPMNPMQRQPSRGGGLLARLFGRSGAGGAAGRGSAATGAAGEAGAGSVLKALGNPDALNTFLANTQNVLNTAQQFGPLIEQYGPLLRNLPGMWKLYRGLKDTDEGKDATSNEASEKRKQDNGNQVAKPEKTAASNKVVESRREKIPAPSQGQSAEKAKAEPARGQSKPRLFYQ
ncbi:VrrA/YqfQ family protein [Neobacillus piezotolerans]|nr:VrrA/YqfQ family protein [Neobacillus piezotolerans]